MSESATTVSAPLAPATSQESPAAPALATSSAEVKPADAEAPKTINAPTVTLKVVKDNQCFDVPVQSFLTWHVGERPLEGQELLDNDPEPELTKSLTEVFVSCETRVKAIVGETEQSPLALAERAYQKAEQRSNVLPVLYSSVEVDPKDRSKVQTNVWRPLNTINLKDPKIVNTVPQDVIDTFTIAKKKNPGIRMAVLCNIIQRPGYICSIYFYVFYMTQQAYLKLVHDPLKALPKLQGPGRIQKIEVGWALRVIRAVQSVESVSEDEKAEAVEMQRKIIHAHRLYGMRRALIIDALYGRMAPYIVTFALNNFSEALLERIDKAAPLAPDRIMMMIMTADTGNIVDLNNSYCVDRRQIDDMGREDEGHLAAAEKKLSATTDPAQQHELKKEIAKLRDRLIKIQRYDNFLSSLNPMTEIAIELREKATDSEGLDISRLIKIEPPYDRWGQIRAAKQAVAELKAAAEKAAKEKVAEENKVEKKKTAAPVTEPTTSAPVLVETAKTDAGPEEKLMK